MPPSSSAGARPAPRHRTRSLSVHPSGNIEQPREDDGVGTRDHGRITVANPPRQHLRGRVTAGADQRQHRDPLKRVRTRIHGDYDAYETERQRTDSMDADTFLQKNCCKYRGNQGRGEKNRCHRCQGHERKCRVVEREAESEQHGAGKVQRPQRCQDPVWRSQIQDQRHKNQRADNGSHQQQRPDREIAQQRFHHRILNDEK